MFDTDEFRNAANPLTVAMGVTYGGETLLADIEEMPHMLIAGTTGSGKSVFIDDIILSIMYRCSPDDVRMLLVDPKEVDLSFYNGIPHLLAPVIYDYKNIFNVFAWAEDEIMNRYKLFERAKVKNLRDYNNLDVNETIPHWLLIVDEYAELMKDYKKDVEGIIDRISRLGRAAGVHLIIATQRPTAEIVTGSIKANLPCRASFITIDAKDTSTLMNSTGTQKLIGSGDMLYSLSSSSGVVHAQAPYVTPEEIHRVVNYVIANNKVRE